MAIAVPAMTVHSYSPNMLFFLQKFYKFRKKKLPLLPYFRYWLCCTRRHSLRETSFHTRTKFFL